MRRVDGVVQHYAWGDPEFIPRLLGTPVDGRPWAELWLGTHPSGPARFEDGTPLEALTGPLPYLLKVLAAAEPLSLQTHPDADRARAGHASGVFPDPNAKPELIRALTTFEALCGIRPARATLDLLDALAVRELRDVVAESGPAAAIERLYRRRLDAAPVVAACADRDHPHARWVARLEALHPGDPSVAVALLLNHVVLEPGEALRLDAGNLHAYLSGAGIELMGASDNVVRGGLTAKHVDIDLLLDVADLSPLAEPVLPASDRHDLPAAGVGLRRLTAGQAHRAVAHELAIDLSGGTWYLAPGDEVMASAETFVVTPC